TGEMPKLSKRQEEVWNIIDEWREMPLQELLRLTDTTAETVRRLEDKGLLVISAQISERDPYGQEHILPTQPLKLNEEQARALERITAALTNAECGMRNAESPAGGPNAEGGMRNAELPIANGKSQMTNTLQMANRKSQMANHEWAFLLHGVTGSGKTEVYLQAIAHALRQGKSTIVLVPEISLTPQTVERFKARFSSGPLQTLVAVLHSHLSAGERHDEWHKIRQGRARIVIGARSAIFAPVDPLGLIIVDEEHEHTYKQEESRRYNARD